MSSPKQAFASRLWLLADLEQANNTRRSFASRAYRDAVWALDHLRPELTADRSELLSIPRIGPTIADMITEFLESGELRRLKRLLETLPIDSARLSRLPRMTPPRLKSLKGEMGVETLDDLAAALAGGQRLAGVGDATAQIWMSRLAELRQSGLPIHRAAAVAERFRSHLQMHQPDVEIDLAGGVARLDEWIEVIELSASTPEGLSEFLAQSALVSALQQRPLVVTTLAGELTFVSKTQPPFRDARLQPQQLRGDFHLHTDWSPDGRQDMETILDNAQALGWDYLAITDHGMGLRFGGLRPEDLDRQRAAIDNLRSAHPGLVILQGAELNIGRDGELDYDDEILAMLDFRLAGVHSNFGLDQGAQTERVIRVISHPLVHAIAHLTGRRIGVRPPIDLDLAAVFEAAAAHSTALEVNGHLDRLDISAKNATHAARAGVLFVVNSDAHRPRELSNSGNGIKVLQRAGVPPERVINTWEADRLLDWLGVRDRFLNQSTD
ncbi:MAG: PHP domain-containing protein [Acidimicrobiia bacterium]